MAVHLIKMAVGAEDIADLARWQAERRAQRAAAGEPPFARHLTRSTPKRAVEVLDGGSIYWVVRGWIMVRQRILELEDARNPEGLIRCGIVLHEELVRVVPRRCRPFQGWRYLEPTDAPVDIAEGAAPDEMPPEMQAELRELGLL
jgi:hypothetical protein